MSMAERFLPLVQVLISIEVILSITVASYLAYQLFKRYRQGFFNPFLLSLCALAVCLGINTASLIIIIIRLSSDTKLYDISPQILIVWVISFIGLVISMGYICFFIVIDNLTINIIRKKKEPTSPKKIKEDKFK